ncbi:MAG: TldD/PmbA family protein [Proteobacteria bacterium]|nr:TldD/PmbA family protein [Pseudomonadota bacterium]
MSADLLRRAQQAVELAKRAGAQEVRATTSNSRDVSFEYRDGALETVKDATSQSLAIQVYVNGRYSSHRTTDLNIERLKDFVSEAIAITKALEPDEFRQITPEELFLDRPDVDLDLVDSAVADLDREQRMEWCQTIDGIATDHARVISATTGVYDGSSQSASVSSNGFSGSSRSTYCWYGANVTLKDQGDKRASGGFYAGSPHIGALPPASEVAGMALERALSRLDSTKGPTVRTTMVVDSRAAGALIGRLLGPANARRVQQGQSYWADLLGERAFSDKLTVIDNPLLKRGFSSRLYDGEGISAKVIPIVEAGVVRNLYVDTYYGRKAGMAPTTGSSSNRIVGTSDKSLAEILGEAGAGVYVTSWLGGNADNTTGDFSLGIRGHMIENGQIGRPVSEMNVTGNLKDLFGRLEMVGNDVYPYSSTLSPTLVFADVNFSGT